MSRQLGTVLGVAALVALLAAPALTDPIDAYHAAWKFIVAAELAAASASVAIAGAKRPAPQAAVPVE